MAGKKRIPVDLADMEHIQVKYISGRAYAYKYDPTTQKEVYLGAMEPVYGYIDSLSTSRKTKLTRMFNKGDDITAIMKQIEVYKGFPISKQAVYAWFREHEIDGRWSK